MWEIYEQRRVVRRIRNLPIDVLKRYEKWKDIVAFSGPGGLHLIKGFKDEALLGDWAGFRSSRLGQKYRIIYRIEAQKIRVFVIDITSHDYRRKDK